MTRTTGKNLQILGKPQGLDIYVDAARRGDGQAFADIVEAYKTPLKNFILSHYPKADTPEDLIQNTWLYAHKRMQVNYIGPGKFDPAKWSFHGWIKAKLVSECLDELRRQKKHGDFDEIEDQRFGREGIPQEERDGILTSFIRDEHEKAVHARGTLLAEQVQEKGMKGARISYMSFTPGWQKVVIDILSKDHPGDSRRLFEARRILAHKETERGIKEWALAIERAQRVGERQLTYVKLWILVDLCVEAALRSRLPRKDPDRLGWGEKDFAPSLSIGLYCIKGLRGGHGPLYEASAAFTNATFQPKIKWTSKRVRQAAFRRGLTPEALHKARIK